MKSSSHTGEVLRKIRTEVGLHAQEVATLLGVTSRTVALWESGAQPMPRERLELLRAKLEKPSDRMSELVVVLGPDGLAPIDCVSQSNFAGLEIDHETGLGVVSSLAVNRQNGKAYVHRQEFVLAQNANFLKVTARWISAWERTLGIDPALLAVHDFLVRKVRAAEERKPKLRILKDRIADLTEAVRSASSESARKAKQDELDRTISELISEVDRKD